MYAFQVTRNLLLGLIPAVILFSVSVAQAQSVSINDPAAVSEGNDVVFSVRLSRATSRTVTMNFASSDDTAIAGVDYVQASGSLSFNAGQIEKQIRIRTLVTSANRDGIRFNVRLSSVRNATISDSRGIGTIRNRAVAPTPTPAPTPIPTPTPVPLAVSVSDSAIAIEGQPVIFQISLNRASASVVTVHYSTQSLEAESMTKPGQDYFGVNSVDQNSPLVFQPGETVRSVSVQTNNDSWVDALEVERFYLNILSASVSVIADGQALGYIRDNDAVAAPTPSPTPTPAPTPAPPPTGGVVTPFDNLNPSFFIYVATSGCSDSNSGHASQSVAAQAPKCTVQSALNTANPGTAVMIRQGSYNFSSTYRMPKSGTLSAPIWVRSADGAGTARLVRTGDKEPIRTNGKSNLVFEGLHFVGGIAMYNATSGVNFSESDSSLQRNIVLRDNTFTQGFEDGIKASFAHGIYVLNNTIFDTADEQGIDFVAVSDSFIIGNTIYNTPSHGIVAKGGSRNVLIENNSVTNMGDSGYAIWSGGSSCETSCLWSEAMAGRYEGRDIIVRNNRVDASIMVMGCRDCTIESNDINGIVKLESSPGPDETPHNPPFPTVGTIVRDNF